READVVQYVASSAVHAKKREPPPLRLERDQRRPRIVRAFYRVSAIELFNARVRHVERRDAIGHLRSGDRRLFGLWISAAEAPSELGGGRRREERRERKVYAGVLVKAVEEPHGEERVPSDLEEVIVHSHLLDAEQLAEEPRNQPLE